MNLGRDGMGERAGRKRMMLYTPPPEPMSQRVSLTRVLQANMGAPDAPFCPA